MTIRDPSSGSGVFQTGGGLDLADALLEASDIRPGDDVGPYTILDRLGEGGMGLVYLAEQTEPIRRKVALKVVKLGMDTKEVLARFDLERRTLAQMSHPNVASVFDAGMTQGGRPYFVMELVEGEPLSKYCDQHRLSINDRLMLFDQVCQAVQHAHTKGIIHRDLKPNNVLVSTQGDRPFAKVIDFGIAKATSDSATAATLYTAQNQMIGTPLYMSPEQAEGSADIDTRSDIYTLGVLLYELLTGTTPFESNSLRSVSHHEVQRIIRDIEPPRPSVRLSGAGATLTDAATHCRMEPRKLRRLVRGELDWIVMKAIEKERARRYETAIGLAMDVRRYLAGQPVHAAPPGVAYRLRKFVRRNKVTVAAAVLVSASLLAGIVAFAYQARIAQQRAAELEQVARFQADMLGQIDTAEAGRLLVQDMTAKLKESLAKESEPDGEQASHSAAFQSLLQRINPTDTARDMIDRTILKPAVSAIDQQFKDQPVVDAALRQVLADRYAGMGMYDAALPLQQHALTRRWQELGKDHPETLKSISRMGELLLASGDATGAGQYLSEVLAGRRRVLGEEHRETLRSINLMGELLYEQGKLVEAEVYVREALEKRRRFLGEQDHDTLISTNNMGNVLWDLGKTTEGESYLRESLELQRRLRGENHPATLNAINNLAAILEDVGKMSEAETYYREALAKYRSALGEKHPTTVSVLSNLGVLLLNLGRLAEAEPLLREALDIRTAQGEEHPDTISSIGTMGRLLQANGQNAEAIALLAPAEALIRRSFSGSNTYRVAVFLTTVGKAHTGLGHYSDAERALIEAHSLLVQSPLSEATYRVTCIRALVDLYTAWAAAAPGEGYEDKAGTWKQRLDEIGSKPLPARA